jgi:hypothetical protein
MSPPHTPANAGKPDPRPRSFLGIRFAWSDSQCMDHGLPKPVRKYLAKAQAAGGLDYDTWLELVDHFRAAIAHGRSPEQIISALGPPRLLGRAIGRVRCPKMYFFARLVSWIGNTLVLCLFLYFALWAGLRWSEPSPSVDYYALLSQPALTTAPETHAWPIYRDLLKDPRLQSSNRYDFSTAFNPDSRSPLVHPTDPLWPQAVGKLHELRPQLAIIRQAAHKPLLGCVFAPFQQLPPDDRLAVTNEDPFLARLQAPAADHPVCRLESDEYDGYSFESQARAISRLFDPIAADMYLAAQESDVPRLLENYHAMLACSAQLRQIPLSTARHLAAGLLRDAIQPIAQISLAYPALLSEAQILDIRLKAAQSSADLDTLPAYLDPAYHDAIQRSYTLSDAGDDGRITRLGLLFLMRRLPSLPNDRSSPDKLPRWGHRLGSEILFPLAWLTFPSRKTLNQEHDQRLSEEKLQTLQPWNEDLGHYPQYTSGRRPTFTHFITMLPRITVLGVIPWGHREPSILPATRANRLADDALLAVAHYRARHGRYPASMADLVPQFCPAAPLSLQPSQHLFIKITPAGPVIYSPGPNGIDDDGLFVPWAPTPTPLSPPNPPQGDIFYYPDANRRITP